MNKSLILSQRFLALRSEEGGGNSLRDFSTEEEGREGGNSPRDFRTEEEGGILS